MKLNEPSPWPREPAKPRCICAEPFWAIYPPTCPAHPDREISEVTL